MISTGNWGRAMSTWKEPWEVTSTDWQDISNFMLFLYSELFHKWPKIRLLTDFATPWTNEKFQDVYRFWRHELEPNLLKPWDHVRFLRRHHDPRKGAWNSSRSIEHLLFESGTQVFRLVTDNPDHQGAQPEPPKIPTVEFQILDDALQQCHSIPLSSGQVVLIV